MTMHGNDWATLGAWAIAAFLLVSFTAGVIADRHRRTTPDEAWKVAGVDRLIWGRIGVRFLNLPLANVYYLLKIRPRLNAAATDIILGDDPPAN